MRKLLIIVFISSLAIGCSKSYKDITAQMPDLNKLEDGIYRGAFDLSGTPDKVSLDVIIQNNRIINIELVEHFCSPIGKKAENIIGKIIETQSLDIDVISVATASSKVILKAVENAFQ